MLPDQFGAVEMWWPGTYEEVKSISSINDDTGKTRPLQKQALGR